MAARNSAGVPARALVRLAAAALGAGCAAGGSVAATPASAPSAVAPAPPPPTPPLAAASPTPEAAPHLSVGVLSISLDSTLLADVPSVEALGKVSLLDPLSASLRQRPARGTPLTFDAAADAPALSAASALMTAAYAGFPVVDFAGTDFRARARVPGSTEDVPPVHVLLRLDLAPNGAPLHLAWGPSRASARAPDADVALADLPAAITRACAGAPCIDKLEIHLAPNDLFTEALAALRAAAANGTPDFGFVFVTGAETVTPADAADEAENQNGLRGHQVAAVIVSAADPFRRCFTAAHKLDPHVGRSVSLSFDIATDGHVTAATVLNESSFRDPEGDSCILAKVKSLLFPHAGRPTRVRTFPLRFR